MDWIVSLTPEASEDPVDAMATPPRGASLIELRADLFPGLDLRAAVSACPLPVLVTFRSTVEGGRGAEDPEGRRRALESARDAGAALLDLEYRRDASLIRELGLSPEQVVLSWHHSRETPESLRSTARQMLESPARWVKVVPTANSVEDLIATLALHREFNDRSRHRRRLLAFAMGAVGVASRYLTPLMGPPLSFAAWGDGMAAAPGQLTIEQTERVISHLDGAPQRLYGVVGSDVSRSLSPALHAAAYKALGLPYLLVPVSVPQRHELDSLFVPAGATVFAPTGLDARGWAVTTPYKEAAAEAADLAAPRVQRAAAANTLILGEERVVAENTDADGVVGSLVSLGVDPVGRKAVVQGTGGAARGAAVGLHLAGAEVFLRSRSDSKARSAAQRIGVEWCGGDAFPEGSSILVNATPLGREPDDPCPFSRAEIAAASAVVDMVYADHRAQLVELAEKDGIAVADGREVLLHQGIAQFAAFNQTVPPKDAMREAVRR